MELKNDFVVDRPVDETWKILTNLELIAPCLPGARLEEVEGEEYRGSVSVKVGPITGKYKGKASFVEQDEAAKVAKLRAEGRDPRQGNANALITAAMVPAGPDGTQTRVDLTTDLGLSGKIASFARGNLEDVSRKLLTQFAQNLEQMLAEEGSGAAAAPSGTPGAESGASVPTSVVAAPDTATAASTEVGGAGAGEGSITEPGGSDRAPTAGASAPVEGTAGTASTGAAAGGTAGAGGSAETGSAGTPGGAATGGEQPRVRKIESPEAKPIDLLAVAGPDTMAKKLAPAVGVVVLLLLIRWLLRRRG